jgi:hypothetical protein
VPYGHEAVGANTTGTHQFLRRVSGAMGLLDKRSPNASSGVMSWMRCPRGPTNALWTVAEVAGLWDRRCRCQVLPEHQITLTASSARFVRSGRWGVGLLGDGRWPFKPEKRVRNPYALPNTICDLDHRSIKTAGR